MARAGVEAQQGRQQRRLAQEQGRGAEAAASVHDQRLLVARPRLVEAGEVEEAGIEVSEGVSRIGGRGGEGVAHGSAVFEPPDRRFRPGDKGRAAGSARRHR
jgi:hypothetical protein